MRKKIMAPTSRKQKTKTGTDVASEAGMSKKPDQAPVIKDKEAVTARPRKPATSAKSNPGIQENEKLKKRTASAKSEKKADKTVNAGKQKKIKLVRDSYSIPETERKQIDALKKRCSDQGKPVKKSYLLRAGLQALAKMDDNELVAAVDRIK
jgi:hypothetical protein